jgi:adenylosuccinate synthase
MTAVVVVGAQWGDEGKGKIVDIFTEHADLVVRYGGGPNAGHTLVVGEDKLVVRLIPSGILRPKTTCVLAQGMAIDPTSLVGELDELGKRGLLRGAGSLVVSDRAHAILPYHVLVDTLREQAPGALGTTKRGVGPCYEDKVARRGVPLGALRDLTRTEALVERALACWRPTIATLGGTQPSVREVMDTLRAAAERVVPLLGETSKLVERAVRDGRRVLFEGAQGTLLDIDHGTYPFVTSSHATAGGITHRRRRGPRQGVLHARRRRTIPHRTDRRRGRGAAQARRRVRIGDRSAATHRVARFAGAPVRGAWQWARRACVDEARRPDRNRRDPGVRRVPHSARHYRRPPDR